MLNATYEPLSVVPARRAVVPRPHRAGRGGGEQRASTAPSTSPSARRRSSVAPLRQGAVRPAHPLNRRAVFIRDDHSCQYCGRPAENLDHVVPRTQGGTHTWDNVVAACRRCNTPARAAGPPSRPACRSSGCPGHRAAAGRWRAARCPTPPGSATWSVDLTRFPSPLGAEGCRRQPVSPPLLEGRGRRGGGEGMA